ncbi:Rho guanyl nucleotide exchange [Grosmannia clavigera kw1407]|uniref:Rho guanyl nucleotide exchange n=1 Tax=Grosmannia clavigera (strain kw1407 / UAMH 11150) TaxID=655863 RepID=F0X8H1_GROCL|nr:Rho guanyl nucleotide exchange [Grosmannia clavigera kw1407]EFX05411.1 Rho guanyl nucleotide exchange [Grosmannia clavigera kw1407]
MVRVTEELAVSPEAVTLYYATDPLLGHLPILAFHGPSTTANFTHNSSRIQVHIYSPAGFQSFPRLTISPNSPFYGAVSFLPREFKGDEVCRGLAFALFKYFSELSDSVKTYLRNQYPTTRGRRPGSAPALFGEQHAADLAKAMALVDSNTPDLLHTLQCALQAQHVTNLDLDLVLPPGAVTPLKAEDLETSPEDEDDIILDPTLRQYDPAYMPLVKLFGDPVFLPTSKLRRAPSRPSSLNHRSKVFTKDQKVELRMKMGELVDTEERYVLKLNELVKHVADDFRQKAGDSTATRDSPTVDELDRLFPRSADRILQMNTAFMQELRRVMDDTEEDAVRDLELPYNFGSSSSRHRMAGGNGINGGAGAGSVRVKDPSGALNMAKTFLEWFPKFTDCYQEYIRASQNFPQLLNGFLDHQSGFRDHVLQTIGEQSLRSILIEPVQRLPRYSLFIDQIVGCLPINHPALQLMLKARDIITNICSMDDPLDEKPQVTNRLRNMVESWPADLEPRGRLVLAADFVELVAPYDADAYSVGAQDRAGLFLLFSDCLILVKKKPGSAATGRDLLREIDKPSPAGLLASMTNAAGGPGTYDVIFNGWHQLADVRFTESADGRLVWMTSTQEMKGGQAGGFTSSKTITSRCFALQESFEGKAARWSEDVVKARIEGRFSEAERENPTWTLRSARLIESNNMGFHAAVFQEGADQLIEGRREPAPVRVVFDNHRGTKGAPIGHYGVEIVVEVRIDSGRGSIGSIGRGNYNDSRRLVMNALGLNGKRYTDDIAIEDFLPTLSRRIIQLTSAQFNTANPKLVPALVSYNTKTLRSLNFSVRIEKTKSFLASGPGKLLSSFLGGGTNNSPIGNNSSAHSSSSDVGHGSIRGTRSQPGSLSHSASNSRHQQQDSTSLNSSLRDRDGGRPTPDITRPENPLVRLEQTFTGYVAAIQARKGQFVGRLLLSRASSTADELSVNLLYNKLNESPFDWESSFDLPPDVVFAAFEKFSRIAWRDQMGTIMTIQLLDALQERAARKVPGDFADFVKYLFSDMAPQNRRAFTALIKLLADLLDGCDDDGDRGALTLAFAELLVADNGEPHNYINLLDLLVEDCDRIFEDNSFGTSLQMRTAYESFNSTARSQRSATGSVTSNTSSLRRKFGLESLLYRQNSNNNRGGSAALEAIVSGVGSSNAEPERPSMWRNLSKHRNPATGDNLPGTRTLVSSRVNRSQSIDMGNQSPMGSRSMRRPASRDRPPIAGAFDEMRPSSSHRPTSSQQLETIGEPDVEPVTPVTPVMIIPERSLRRKRRSSLSDLKSLMAAASLEEDAMASAPLMATNGLEDSPLAPAPLMTPGGLEESLLPPAPLRTSKTTSEKSNSGPPPQTPSPHKITTSPESQNCKPLQPSPEQQQQQQQQQQQRPALQRHQRQQSQPSVAYQPSPRQKENGVETPTYRTARVRSPSSFVALSDLNMQGHGHSKTLSGSSSYIPTLRAPRGAGVLSPGGDSPASSLRSPYLPPPSPSKFSSGSTSPTRTNSAPGQKLRLQSPQKLRERLQTEKEAVGEADASLKTELSRIAADMARVNSGGAVSPLGLASEGTPSRTGVGTDLRRLESSLKALEEHVSQVTQSLADKQEALQLDMDNSVRVAEAKVRAIDQLYKEATAENELLYEKFNTELGKIVKALKGKGRDDKEELVTRLKEQSEETARLKKENARMRREAVSLRTLLKAGNS